MIRSAIEKKKLKVGIHDLRSYSQDRIVDDYPYGGGAGMVLKAEPVLAAVEDLKKRNTTTLLFTPGGRTLDQRLLAGLSQKKHLLLICGRYKAIDQRVKEFIDPVLVSIGDYVLSGGEIGALILIDGVARLLPGVLRDPDSARTDSFSSRILDCPYYTRPRVVRRRSVPRVLLSGNHRAIQRWRKKASLKTTIEKRPDLLKKKSFNREEVSIILEVLHERGRLQSWRYDNRLFQDD